MITIKVDILIHCVLLAVEPLVRLKCYALLLSLILPVSDPWSESECNLEPFSSLLFAALSPHI